MPFSAAHLWFASRLRRGGRQAAGAGAALLLAAAGATAAAPDKSAYTLGNPTPAGLLRELAPDRPDVTEGPFTVDAGHAQIELDFANFTRDRLDGVRTTTAGVAPFEFRLGLRENLEAAVFVSPYVRVAETPRGGPRRITAGFGGATLRAKVNFQGNDGGGTAFGVIADVTLPWAAQGLGSGKVEGALTLPVAFDLPGGWDGTAMTQVAMHQGDGSTRAVWLNSTSFGHELARNFSGYLELTSSAGEGAHVATFDAGVTWKLNANTQLDGGANLGLSKSADDVMVFAGLSRRF